MGTQDSQSYGPTTVHEFARTYTTGPLAGSGRWLFQAYWRRQAETRQRELVWRARPERDGHWSREIVEPGYPDTAVSILGWPTVERHILSAFASRVAAQLFGTLSRSTEAVPAR